MSAHLATAAMGSAAFVLPPLIGLRCKPVRLEQCDQFISWRILPIELRLHVARRPLPANAVRQSRLRQPSGLPSMRSYFPPAVRLLPLFTFVNPFDLDSGAINNNNNNNSNNNGNKSSWGDDGRDDGDHGDLSQLSLATCGFAAYLVAARRYYPRHQSSRGTSAPSFKNLKISHILLFLNATFFALQALIGPSVLLAGAKVNPAIAAGQYYRLVSPMFLHGSLTHLVVNMLSLHSTGPSLESWFGRRRFTTLYLASGICGNVLSYMCTPTAAVGASGAIFGLVGATGVLLLRHDRLLGPRARRSLQSLVYIVIMNFGMGMAPGSQIDNFGHLGGFLGGIAFAYMFGPRLVTRRMAGGRVYVQDDPVWKGVARELRARSRQLRSLMSGK